MKYDIVIHAEMNAIINCHTRPEGWALYCTHIPCIRCATVIIGAGITKVIAYGRKGATDMGYDKTLLLLQEAGLEVRLHQ